MLFNVKMLAENKRMKCRIVELERRTEELQTKIDNLIDNAYPEIGDSEFVIDFNNMRVFSIERRLGENIRPVTVIGYYMNNPIVSSDGEMIFPRDIVEEWTLYCSGKRHQELIAEFRKWQKNNVHV